MADAYAATNPKRALKRREDEAGEGNPAVQNTKEEIAEDMPPAKKKAPVKSPDGDGGQTSDVQLSRGKPAAPTPEEKAKRDEQFRALQRKQRNGTTIL